MQNLALQTLQNKDSRPLAKRLFASGLPSRGHDAMSWRQKFLNELPSDTREIVSTALKHEGGGQFLVHLSKRAGAANTAADLAYLLGVSEETLQPLLKWLDGCGIVETTRVEDITFYKLGRDQRRRKHVDLFREHRDRWLEQMRNMTDWLDGQLPRPADF